MLACVLAVAACSPDDPAASSTPGEGGADGENGPVLDSEGVADIVTPSDGPAPHDRDGLSAAWELFHAAWVEQAAADEPDPAAFDDIAVDPDDIVEMLTARRGDTRLVTTNAELWPQFSINGQSAEITDCVIVAQHPDGQPDSAATVTIGWEATAVATEDGWRIDTARQLDLFCIAEELNEQLLAAYRDFRAAKEAAWDPPNPEHPDLERTMTGEQLEFIHDLLGEHAREGIVIREPAPTDNAVVFEIGIGTATISDCTQQAEGYGAFDVDTGQRLDELIPAVEPGRLDAQSVNLVREPDGRWKVADQAASRDTDCVEGSTRYAVR